jgi:hypothetical protein
LFEGLNNVASRLGIQLFRRNTDHTAASWRFSPTEM